MAWSIIIYALSAILLYILYVTAYQFLYWKIRKVPHLGLVPLLGNNAPIALRKVSFPQHIFNLYKNFEGARYYGLFDFAKPTLMIKDPELIREIGIKHFDNFMDHRAFVSEEMDPIAGRNVFSLRGQRWRELRGTLSPSYTASRMKLLFELIAECSSEFVQYFIEHPEMAKEFDVKRAFTRYTNDVIATTAFGIKVNSMRDQNNEFYLNGQAATKFSGLWFAKFQFMYLFPKIMRFLGATFLPKSTDKFFKQLIINTVKVRQDKGVVRPDMIQLLTEAMNKEDGVKVTMEDIIGQSVVFFLAGFDTTSSLMTFASLELAVNQDIQEKLYKEIIEHFPNESTSITYEKLTEMKYLDMVLKESLRLYPPAALTNRVCVQDFTFPPCMDGYPEYRMIKDTIIMIPIIALHRDPKYYPEPEKFKPERFSEENKSKINPYTYMPFGIGPRKCIGERFALMETKIVMIHILQKFVIKCTENTQYPVEFSKDNFNLSIKGGALLKFEERKKNN